MFYRKITALLLALVLVLLTAACDQKSAQGAAPAISKTGKTVILHTNDTHGRMAGSEQSVGISALKALKDSYIAQGMNVILLDAGDTFHGDAFANLDKGKSILALMTMAGYDAMTPGNHDFNYGVDYLVDMSYQAHFPMLSSNLLKRGSDKKVLDGYAVIQRENIKIGIFGLCTPETAYMTNPENVASVEFYNPYAAAAEAVSVLKAAEVDYIIALCHLGLDSSSEYTSEGVAQSVAGIDLIVDGHSHTLLEQGKKVGNTLVVSVGQDMQAVGVVTLDHATRSATAEVLKAGNPKLQGLADSEIDAKIQAMSADQQQILSEVLGTTPVDLNGKQSDIRAKETNLGNLVADAMRVQSGAQIALANSGGICGSIPAGEITKRKIIDVLPFGNYIVTKKVNGANLRAALEKSVEAYPKETGAFLQVSGLSFTFDASAAVGGRVKTVLIGGKPLDISAEYVVAMNDFMASGGDGFSMLKSAKTQHEFSALDEVLMQHINQLSDDGESFPRSEARITVIGQENVDSAILPDSLEQPNAAPRTVDADSGVTAQLPETMVSDAKHSQTQETVESQTGGEDDVYYVVDYDDNVWNIAKEQLGDANLWDEILAANKDIIKDQDHIYVGQRLRLPKQAS